MLIALMLSAFAQAPTCERTTLGRLAAEPGPAVFVLGERPGTPPDPARALKLVKKLRKKGPVTLALQAVPVGSQGVLDGWAKGQVPDELLGAQLGIFSHYGHAPDRYEGLIRASALGVDVHAAGVAPEAPPEGVVAPQPPAYIHVLGPAMGEAPVPVELEARYLAMVAWTDHRIARDAIEAWSGEGALVILADRLHVQGGKGIAWQAGLMTEAPVHNVLLKQSDSPCIPGDLHLR